MTQCVTRQGSTRLTIRRQQANFQGIYVKNLLNFEIAGERTKG